MSGAGGGGFLSLSLSISGQQVEGAFVTWSQAIETLQPAFEEVGGDLLTDFAANFQQEGGLFGMTSRSYLGANAGPWQQLANSTVRDRMRYRTPGEYGGEHPILVRSGNLKRSLTMRNAPGNIFEVGPSFLTVGTSIAYAGFHQKGTRKMPARVIVGLSYERRQRIKARLRSYITEQARLAGLKAGLGRATEDFWNE